MAKRGLGEYVGEYGGVGEVHGDETTLAALEEELKFARKAREALRVAGLLEGMEGGKKEPVQKNRRLGVTLSEVFVDDDIEVVEEVMKMQLLMETRALRQRVRSIWGDDELRYRQLYMGNVVEDWAKHGQSVRSLEVVDRLGREWMREGVYASVLGKLEGCPVQVNRGVFPGVGKAGMVRLVYGDRPLEEKDRLIKGLVGAPWAELQRKDVIATVCRSGFVETARELVGLVGSGQMEKVDCLGAAKLAMLKGSEGVMEVFAEAAGVEVGEVVKGVVSAPFLKPLNLAGLRLGGKLGVDWGEAVERHYGGSDLRSMKPGMAKKLELVRKVAEEQMGTPLEVEFEDGGLELG